MAIHKINEDGTILPYKKMPVAKELQIEDFIEKNPEWLEEDLIIINRQQKTSFGKIVDLIGLDNSGNIVIIELKKDSTPREVISQILDYAVWVEELKYEDLNLIYKSYPNATHPNLIKKFQEIEEDPEPELFNQNQKLYIIAEEIDEQTSKLAKYLRRKGIEIFCIEINFHQLNGENVVAKREIVTQNNTPTQISSLPKTEDEHISKGTEKTQEIYKLLKSRTLQLGNDILVKTTRSYIAFERNGYNFLSVRIRSNYLKIHLKYKEGLFNDPKKLCKPHRRREDLKETKIFEKDSLDEVMNLVKQSYDTLK